MSRPFLSTAAAAILSVSTAFPAAAQKITVQQSNYSDGAGVILRAASGKVFQGHINVGCNDLFVSFYKAGSETAITVSGGNANKVSTVSGSSAPLEKIPDDLDPAKLCVAGRPDVPTIRANLLDRLAKN